MTPTPKLASGAVPHAGTDDRTVSAAGAAAPSGPFVLNLCSSSTPMALEHPQLAQLKRFTFFVSRRLEEGRERFRLHMGYFASLAEAEEWLNAVRDIYPGAWAGEAPGKKLRERAAAAAQAAQTPAAVPAATPSQPPHMNIAVPTLRAAPPPPAAAVPVTVPVVNAAPPAPRTTVGKTPSTPAAPPRAPAPQVRPPAPNVARSTAPAPASRPVTTSVRPSAPAARAPAPAAKTITTNVPKAPAVAPKPTVQARQTTAPAQSASRAAIPTTRPVASAKAAARSALPSSNVREVLAALDETTGETRMMLAPVMPSAEATDDAALTDTQVLRFLEVRRDESTEKPADEPETGSISLLKPDDTGTRRALKEAVTHNAPVSFAVQLQWSVQPVELESVPPLAIFSAYTLYTVDGSRDGRKWYGLRLGFFTDALSAKQVAYYVRSEFSSVAVVPVSPQERIRASDDEKKTSGLAFPRKTRQEKVDEFKLIDDTAAAPPLSAKPRAAAKPATTAANPRADAAGRRPGRVRAREHRSPQTLEETLEILGASQLEIDNGRGETLNDSGVRHLRVEVRKDTPFRRLIDRLSERTKKG